MGVLQGIAAGALMVMAMVTSLLAVVASSFMRCASRPRAWQTAAPGAATCIADLIIGASIGLGLAAGLCAWWVV